jgi:hypothetical protein
MQINQFTLTRSRALHWLGEMIAREVAFTVYVSFATPRQEIEKMLLTVLDRGQLLDEIVEKAEKSPTGATIFYGKGAAYVIWPPFPLRGSEVTRSCDVNQVKLLLEHEWRLALVLVRLGQYAVGIFKGDRLEQGQAGTGLVHARHHKGGSSSMRFARHREKQMETFFTRVEIHARETIEARLKEIDYVLYGGTRDTLQIMKKQCRFFSTLDGKTVGRLLSVREPKRSTFDEAIAQAYTSTVFEITE